MQKPVKRSFSFFYSPSSDEMYMPYVFDSTT